MSEDSLKIFSPEGINVNDYKKKYPELEKIQDFKPIKPKELAFIWYIANPTSFLVYKCPDREERVHEAWKIIGGDENFPKQFLQRRLSNQTALEGAERRMQKTLPTVRSKANDMAIKCFDDIDRLLQKGEHEFITKSGEMDIKAFMAVRKFALESLPEMVRIAEEGFGVSSNEGTKVIGQSLISSYIRGKQD